MKRAGLLLLVACGSVSETAMRVRVDFAPDVSVDQLSFTSSAGKQLVFGPELRPVRPGGLLTSGDALLVLMPDELADQEVECPVDGLRERDVVASGSGNARLVLGLEVECVATLKPVRN